MKTRKPYIIALPILALVSMPAAAGGKSYPGALCQSTFQNQTFERDQIGRMFNTSTALQNWICPIVRDNLTASTNGIQSAIVSVRDVTDAGSVGCQLFSAVAAGGIFDTGGGPFSTNFTDVNLAAQDLNVAPNGIDSVSNGYYYLRCNVPPVDSGQKSGIVSYRVFEKNL